MRSVVEVLLPAVDEYGIEVIGVCAGDGGAHPAKRPGVTYVAIPETDVFAARAAGVMLATGDVVALLEDHSLPAGDWASNRCSRNGTLTPTSTYSSIRSGCVRRPVLGRWHYSR